MQGKLSSLRDAAAGALVLTALALPLVPVPGDGTAKMKVHFRTESGAQPQLLSTETSSSVCHVMAAALSYENPDGTFTQVNCQD